MMSRSRCDVLLPLRHAMLDFSLFAAAFAER